MSDMKGMPLMIVRRIRLNLHRVSVMGALAMCSLFIAGCGGNNPQPPNPKPVVPVTGIIHIDGAPALGVEVKFHRKGGMDMSNPSLSHGRTKEDGSFQLTTYAVNDGAPPGDYLLTFENFGPLVIGMEAVDKFGGAMSYPDRSDHPITVPAEVPDGAESFDIGTIELQSP